MKRLITAAAVLVLATSVAGAASMKNSSASGKCWDAASSTVKDKATTFRAGPDPAAPVAGTLSVAGPLPRMPEERRLAITEALGRAAAEMADIWPLRRRQIPQAQAHPLVSANQNHPAGTPA